jgi:DGQHR domain-containing protein
VTKRNPKTLNLQNEDPKSISFPCFEFEQPLGPLYVGVMNSRDLVNVTFFDIRKIAEDERALDTYLGIQRQLSDDRVKELQQFVNLKDASFPTGIILAVEMECASYDPATKTMTFSNYMDAENKEDRVFFRDIAKIIDGQHRIEGLKAFKENKKDKAPNDSRAGENDQGEEQQKFELPVVIMLGMDIADQAYVFSTVNLAQTKVSPSLAYDLFAFAKSRSPQKTCHNIAVALDNLDNSPLHKRIKRLGVATQGRFNETLTQSTFIRALMPYLSENPVLDRDVVLRGMSLPLAKKDELQKLIFRNLFIEERDLEIFDIVRHYFEAIKERWPIAWTNLGQGNILNRTNGFRAFMRLLRPAYLFLTQPGSVPTKEQFLTIMRRIRLSDDQFTTVTFKPGSSGEALLFHTMLEQAELEE